MDEAYIDVLFMDYYLPKKTEHLNGIKGFMARNLGITLYPRKEELQLEKMQYEDAKFRLMQDALTGKGYPSRLFPIPEKEKDVKAGHINYMRRYSPISLILIFFVFCVTGGCGSKPSFGSRWNICKSWNVARTMDSYLWGRKLIDPYIIISLTQETDTGVYINCNTFGCN